MAIGESNSWRTVCLVVVVSFLYMVSLSYQSDTIFLGQCIYANQTITSQGGVFELGFFSLGNSGRFYVGIWHKRIPSFTVVWVANRDAPILSSARDRANLILTVKGDLQLQVDGRIFWSTYPVNGDNTTKAVLLDNGKLAVGSDDRPNMWESFDYPTDTWLPGAPLHKFTSWKNLDDPGSGTYALDRYDSSSIELELRNNENYTRWRIRASNDAYINFSEGFSIVSYTTLDNSTTIRMLLDHSGLLRLLTWNEKRARWLTLWAKPNDFCERVGICGRNGICSINQDPSCKCLRGFQPKSISDWKLGDFSDGCIRSSRSQCLIDKDEFIALHNIKLPLDPMPLSLEGAKVPVEAADICRSACASNCRCSAYSNTSECYRWIGDLRDVEQLYNTTAGETIYLRVFSQKEGEKMLLLVTLAPSICGLILVVLGSLSYCAYKKLIVKGAKGQDLLSFDLETTNKRHENQVQSDSDNKRGNRDLALPTFSLSSIFSATDNFSSSNKLGEGGFGPVYKGKLRSGQEVAVKRLSKHSGQGLKELINEAKLIAKLQHTNLVRLLGCCIQKDEKILIYEYMPNKSLDFFLFDRIQRETLDWSRRVCIIKGIAQGLLYLHHYSRLRIIHRDLKASNILLDVDMKPKISDFGMAKIFGENQLQANTKHIAGTFGYMPPEYALEGLFSIKSDVFSFGVLFLEIISGERNTSFRHEECLSLLGYAWKLWTNDTPLEMMDPILKKSCDLPMALRCVHVGLLCVQEHPDDRPNMLDAVAMIGNEKKVIETQPKQPAYLARRRA